jgi:flagellar FliL protein
MAEAEAKKEAKGEAKPSGGGGKLVPIVLVVNSLLLTGVLAVLLLRPGGLRQGPAEKEEQHAASEAKPQDHAKAKDAKKGDAGAPPGPTLRLPDFIVHLRDGEFERYARISFEVEVADEKAKEGLTARLPLIRDAFLAYLSDRSAEELRGSGPVAHVKDALAKKLSQLAPEVAVRALYVTDLVIQ